LILIIELLLGVQNGAAAREDIARNAPPRRIPSRTSLDPHGTPTIARSITRRRDERTGHPIATRTMRDPPPVANVAAHRPSHDA